MKTAHARALLVLLSEAIDRADILGKDEIDLAHQLQQFDDDARAELEAAIKRAEGGAA